MDCVVFRIMLNPANNPFYLPSYTYVMKSSPPPYEIWEHTADIGIIAHGKSPEEVFKSAAHGMFDIICGKAQKGKFSKIAGNEMRREIALSARALDSLMVDWLSELLYLFSAFRFLGTAYGIKVEKTKDGWRVSGDAIGTEYNRKKHGYGADIKAVTYHMLEVKEENGIWSAKILFDI